MKNLVNLDPKFCKGRKHSTRNSSPNVEPRTMKPQRGGDFEPGGTTENVRQCRFSSGGEPSWDMTAGPVGGTWGCLGLQGLRHHLRN